MPTLAEVMASDPGIRSEVETRDIASEKKGRDAVAEKIKRIKPYLASEYPSPIRMLAVKALGGEQSEDALIGAVTLYDIQQEQINSQAANAESAELGETAADDGQTAPAADGSVNNENDFQAALAADRKRYGLA